VTEKLVIANVIRDFGVMIVDYKNVDKYVLMANVILILVHAIVSMVITENFVKIRNVLMIAIIMDNVKMELVHVIKVGKEKIVVLNNVKKIAIIMVLATMVLACAMLDTLEKYAI